MGATDFLIRRFAEASLPLPLARKPARELPDADVARQADEVLALCRSSLAPTNPDQQDAARERLHEAVSWAVWEGRDSAVIRAHQLLVARNEVESMLQAVCLVDTARSVKARMRGQRAY